MAASGGRVVDAEFAELAIERRAADPQSPRNLGHPPTIMADGESDDIGLDILERPQIAIGTEQRDAAARNAGGADHAGAPVALVYGHHDVQPVDPLELWERPPFEPTRVEGPDGPELHARGAIDDKGNVAFHLLGMRAHLAATDRALVRPPLYAALPPRTTSSCRAETPLLSIAI